VILYSGALIKTTKTPSVIHKITEMPSVIQRYNRTGLVAHGMAVT